MLKGCRCEEAASSWAVKKGECSGKRWEKLGESVVVSVSEGMVLDSKEQDSAGAAQTIMGWDWGQGWV